MQLFDALDLLAAQAQVPGYIAPLRVRKTLQPGQRDLEDAADRPQAVALQQRPLDQLAHRGSDGVLIVFDELPAAILAFVVLLAVVGVTVFVNL